MSMMLRFQSLLLSPAKGTYTFVYSTEDKRKQAFRQALRVMDSMQVTQHIDRMIVTDCRIEVFGKIFLFMSISNQITGLRFDQVIYDEIELDRETFSHFQSRIIPTDE